MFCFNFGHLINRLCLYPFPFVCWMKTDLLNNMGKWFNQGLSNTIEIKMCVRERGCEWKKPLSSISCQADGETGGDPVPPGSWFKLWHKSYSEKTEGPSDSTQLLYWLLLWICSWSEPLDQSVSLNEEAELWVMLEIGEGFGVKGAAADMKCIFSRRNKQVTSVLPCG